MWGCREEGGGELREVREGGVRVDNCPLADYIAKLDLSFSPYTYLDKIYLVFNAFSMFPTETQRIPELKTITGSGRNPLSIL